VQAGLSCLAAAGAARLPAAVRAECLRRLERAGAAATAARAWLLASFTAGQGYADDGACSAVSWLIHQAGITKGCRGRARGLGQAHRRPPAGAGRRAGAGGAGRAVRGNV
jgi:hypothetical protein